MRGFTLIELIVVVLLIASLASIALPRFLDADDEARTAAAQYTASSFAESLATLRGEWLVKGKPSSLTLDGVSIDFDSNGRVDPTATGSAGCMEMWDEVLKNPEPIVPYVANAAPESWSALGAGTLCLFIHQYGQAYSVSNQQPFILYQTSGDTYLLRNFNM